MIRGTLRVLLVHVAMVGVANDADGTMRVAHFNF